MQWLEKVKCYLFGHRAKIIITRINDKKTIYRCYCGDSFVKKEE